MSTPVTGSAAACGIAPGSAIARPVKLARQAITAGAGLGHPDRGLTDLRSAVAALRESLKGGSPH